MPQNDDVKSPPDAQTNLYSLKATFTTVINSLLGTAATHGLDVIHARKIAASAHEIMDAEKAAVAQAETKKNLSKGLRLNVMSNLMRGGILFGSTAKLQSSLKQTDLSDRQIDEAAFTAGSTIEGIVWSPITYVKNQIWVKNLNTTSDVLRALPRRDIYQGIRKAAFWGGIRNFSFSLPYIHMVKSGEKLFIKAEDDFISKTGTEFCIGAAAGIPPSIFSYLSDWTQKQMINYPHRSFRELVTTTYQHKGFSGFYVGYHLVVLRMTIASGVMNVAVASGDTFYHEAKAGFPFFSPKIQKVKDYLNKENLRDENQLLFDFKM